MNYERTVQQGARTTVGRYMYQIHATIDVARGKG